MNDTVSLSWVQSFGQFGFNWDTSQSKVAENSLSIYQRDSVFVNCSNCYATLEPGFEIAFQSHLENTNGTLSVVLDQLQIDMFGRFKLNVDVVAGADIASEITKMVTLVSFPSSPFLSLSFSVNGVTFNPQFFLGLNASATLSLDARLQVSTGLDYTANVSFGVAKTGSGFGPFSQFSDAFNYHPMQASLSGTADLVLALIPMMRVDLNIILLGATNVNASAVLAPKPYVGVEFLVGSNSGCCNFFAPHYSIFAGLDLGVGLLDVSVGIPHVVTENLGQDFGLPKMFSFSILPRTPCSLPQCSGCLLGQPVGSCGSPLVEMQLSTALIAVNASKDAYQDADCGLFCAPSLDAGYVLLANVTTYLPGTTQEVDRALVYKDSATCLVAFRGTNNIIDALSNLIAVPVPFYSANTFCCAAAHGGFVASYQLFLTNTSLMSHLEACIGSFGAQQPRLIITGHSRGGAFANLMGVELLLSPTYSGSYESLQVLTFGEPASLIWETCDARVNSLQKFRFVNTYTYPRSFSGSAMSSPLPMVDPVPIAVPDFYHIGYPVELLSPSYQSSVSGSRGFIVVNDSKGFVSNWPGLTISVGDPTVALHSSLLYQSNLLQALAALQTLPSPTPSCGIGCGIVRASQAACIDFPPLCSDPTNITAATCQCKSCATCPASGGCRDVLVCTSSADCCPGQRCAGVLSSFQCVTKLALGSPCQTDGDCVSNACLYYLCS